MLCMTVGCVMAKLIDGSTSPIYRALTDSITGISAYSPMVGAHVAHLRATQSLRGVSIVLV